MLIEKNCDYDGTKVSFRYFGNSKNKDVNEIDDKTLINKIFDNCMFCDSEMIVRYIRTILKDYDEKYFDITITYDKDVSRVNFYGGKLQTYENTVAIDHSDKNSDVLGVTYSNGGDINFSLSNKSTNLSDNNTARQIYNFINHETQYISKLRNIEPIELTKEDKTLIEIYRLFYNDNPDFCDNNINNKVQSMMYILSEFGIDIDCADDFCMHNSDAPTSIYYQYMVIKLIPFGKYNKKIDDIKLNNEEVETIKIIGEKIRNYLNTFKEENRVKEFRKICTISFAKKYLMSSTSTEKDIAKSKHVQCSEETVVKTLSLIREIDKDI